MGDKPGMKTSDILVIGAGMAGLTCAARLAEAGLDVSVIDKGRGPGGRMATRRVEIAGKVIGFDHGAQYFTARNEGFRKTVAYWEQIGVAASWPAAGKDAHVGTPGMNGPIRALAQALDVEWNVRADRLSRKDGRWLVTTDLRDYVADTLLVAVPAEQSATLLKDAVPALAAAAASVRSEPCWATMAAFAERLPVDSDVLRGADGEAISWAARNSAKPSRSGAETWVIHASPSRSHELLEDLREQVATMLVNDFFAQVGIVGFSPIHLTAHRWLFAMAKPLEGEPARYDAEARIGIAGDYLHSPRVEGAWTSGRALADAVLTTRGPASATAG
jgi:predicted NAD/FAD-dependent oxidoreductase